MKRRTAPEMRAFRAKMRCFTCNQVRHWKNECPERGQAMTDIIRSRVKEHGKDDRAAAEVLYVLLDGDDK